VTEQVASATVRRALELGIRLFDTAPLYGLGASERRLGTVLSGQPRERFVVSTKVGRLLRPSQGRVDEFFKDAPHLEPYFDFSRDAVLRSLEESRKRLGLERIDIALIHDPDDHYRQAIEEAYPTLADLRAQGVIRAIGAGMNQWRMPARFAREGDFDCFLLAGRYTLLEHEPLREFLPLCRKKGIAVIVGGPYNSGILASDLGPGVKYNYAAAPEEVLSRARRLKAVCDRHGVPLKAAALQFVLAHPAVASAIPGARSAAEVEDNVRMVRLPIPSEVWRDMKDEGLIPREAPVPDSQGSR
jgi:D-threo-aldose 1-dehydrogenase